MKIITASIDLSKIDKTKIQTTDRNGNPFKNGGKYYNLQIIINDSEDDYGNNVGIVTGQTKEQRERKEKRHFIGNGKVVWDSEGPIKKKEERKQASELLEDDLPF